MTRQIDPRLAAINLDDADATERLYRVTAAIVDEAAADATVVGLTAEASQLIAVARNIRRIADAYAKVHGR